MRTLKLFVLMCCCFSSVNLFAQTPVAIEADLLKSFKRIDYCSEKRYNDKTYDGRFEDSLSEANKLFGEKLKYYAEKYPATIMQKFFLLKKEGLNISTSNNGLFRIYSWDTEEGGTEHSFENVFQYKFEDKAMAVIDKQKNEDFLPAYDEILTVMSNGQHYYISNFLFIESSRYHDEGIQVFTIENGKLNDHFKLIKTKSGLHNQINYEYDLTSVADMNKIPGIVFNEVLKTINMPIVDTKGRFIKGYITYKFTGQYFEKVK